MYQCVAETRVLVVIDGEIKCVIRPSAHGAIPGSQFRNCRCDGKLNDCECGKYPELIVS